MGTTAHKYHMYLFVAFPNNSGSTLVYNLLATSPNVSCFQQNKEGHDVCREYMPHPGKLPHQPTRTFTESTAYFLDPKEYNWEMIKKRWHHAWNMKKPIQLEKSPTNVVKARLMAYHLQPSKFILGIREPRAFVKSLEAFNVKAYDAALHWKRCAEAQLENMKHIDPSRFILIRYIDICERPERACCDLIEFEPLLERLDWQSLNIKSANKGEELSKQSLEIIRSVLKKEAELLQRFGYSTF